MGAIPVTLPPSVVPTTFEEVTLPELVSTILRQVLAVQSIEPTNNCAFAPISMGPWIPSEISTEVAAIMVVVLTNVSRPQVVAVIEATGVGQSFCGAGGVPATKSVVPCRSAVVAPPGMSATWPVNDGGVDPPPKSNTEIAAAPPPHSG